MTHTKELNELISRIESMGATVSVEWDADAELEGRKWHKSIQLTGIAGVGPCPMSPVYAAERMREVLENA